jgi:hypothetical protein
MKNIKNTVFLMGVLTWFVTGGYLSIAFLLPNLFEPTISLKIFGVSFFIWFIPTIFKNVGNLTKLAENPASIMDVKKTGCSSCKQKK